MWQADTTYVATKEGWLYVAGVLDACTRKIVGWAADEAMPTGLVARAFERAVAAGQPSPGLLQHSDRGSQYAYRELLRSHGVQASMSRAGNCDDNAKVESFWATLKTELIDGQVYNTRAEAKSASQMVVWSTSKPRSVSSSSTSRRKKGVPQVPAHGQQDNLGGKVPPLEGRRNRQCQSRMDTLPELDPSFATLPTEGSSACRSSRPDLGIASA